MCASMSSSKMQSSCNMIKMHEHVYIKYFQFLAKKKIDPRKICPCLTKNIYTKNFPFFAKVLFSSSWVSVYFLGILWVFLQTNLPMVEPFSNGKWQNIRGSQNFFKLYNTVADFFYLCRISRWSQIWPPFWPQRPHTRAQDVFLNSTSNETIHLF